MAKGKKLTKEELRRDPIKESLLRAYEWSRHNRDKVIYGIGVFIVLIVSAGIFFGSRGKSPPENELKFLGAIVSLNQGDTTQFVNLLQDVINTAPKSSFGKRAMYYLAQYKLSRGDDRTAEELIKRYIKSKLNDPILDPGAYGILGSIYFKRGDMEKSASYYLAAEEESPYESVKAFFGYKAAKCYVEAKNYKKALEIMEELIKKYPKTSIVQEVVKNDIPFLRGALEGSKALDREGKPS
jgi:TolA-binding protein